MSIRRDGSGTRVGRGLLRLIGWAAVAAGALMLLVAFAGAFQIAVDVPLFSAVSGFLGLAAGAVGVLLGLFFLALARGESVDDLQVEGDTLIPGPEVDDEDEPNP